MSIRKLSPPNSASIPKPSAGRSSAIRSNPNHAPRPSKLDPFKPTVDRLLAENDWNTVVILHEIQVLGYIGGRSILGSYVTPKRVQQPSRASIDFTDHRRDDSGSLFSNARSYDPKLARFLSADTVVPGKASGGMDGVAYRPLTVAFHEAGFAQ